MPGFYHGNDDFFYQFWLVCATVILHGWISVYVFALVKAVQCTVKKIKAYSWLKYRLVNLRVVIAMVQACDLAISAATRHKLLLPITGKPTRHPIIGEDR